MNYKTLVETYTKLDSTTKRLEKTKYLAEILKKTPESDLEPLIMLLKGKVFPDWEDKKIGVASKLVIKAINVATGKTTSEIEKEWKKTGDLGETTKNLVKTKKQSTFFKKDLSIKKVFENIKKLATIEGQGSIDKKIKLIAELLTSAEPDEAKYITRMILEDLRIGVGDGSIRDAIAWAFFPKIITINTDETKGKTIQIDKKIDIEKKNIQNYDLIQSENPREVYNHLVSIIQDAIDISNDYALVTKTAKEKGVKGLQKITLNILKPIKVMLFQKAEDIKDAFERVGEPAAFEFKYDGFRLQIHRLKDKIKLYTRRLEDVTAQFPDVVELCKSNIKSENYILDTEVIGFDPKTKNWLPFQNISQRIKRKYNIQDLIKKVPIIINIFDAIEINNTYLLEKPFKERRKEIEKIVKQEKNKIQLAEQLITKSEKEAEKFYNKALKLGNEGLMAKNLETPYKPGSRVGYGVKIKPTMENLDLVVTGAEWGEGKRASWLSSFTVSIRDKNQFKEIGKVGTGFKEKEEEGLSFKEMTELLKPITTEEKGKSIRVKAKIVLELSYEEIQKSPKYSSGYALRFPRVLRLRTDKPVSDIATLKDVESLYKRQKK